MPADAMVIHYTDGRTLSGHGVDFPAGRTEFVVREAATGVHVTVHLREVKLICFVRSLSSSGVVRNREQPPVLHAAPGHRVELTFSDGERMGGFVTFETRPEHGFFLAPLNPNANSVKIYVNPEALLSFRFVT